MTVSALPTKRCSRCGQDKPLDELSPNRHHSDGLQSYCKACGRLAVREQRATNFGYVVRSGLQQRAYNAALAVLRERHRAETDAIYADELAKRGLS